MPLESRAWEIRWFLIEIRSPCKSAVEMPKTMPPMQQLCKSVREMPTAMRIAQRNAHAKPHQQFHAAMRQLCDSNATIRNARKCP